MSNTNFNIDTIDTNNSTTKDDEDKPLIQLFKCLINDRDKQNTVLTNTQLMDILQKEFNVKVMEMHVLELDIYMNVMKKYLKVWPGWDDFDKIIGGLKEENRNSKELEVILTEKYNSICIYLKKILEASRPAAQEMVKKVVQESTSVLSKQEKKTDNEAVMMEVQCTRAQLNQLIFRRPNVEYNHSIFNVDYAGPSRISLNTLPLKSIFNWSLLSVQINLNVFVYKRESLHRLKHTLVNKNIPPNIREPPIFDTGLYEKELQKLTGFAKDRVEKYINKIITQMCKQNPLFKKLIKIVFDLVKDDFKYLPKMVKAPGRYKRTANRYPYVRYLCTEPDLEADGDKYDLQLEERITPSFHYHVNRVSLSSSENPIPISNDWLKIECIYCQVKFYGMNLIENLQQHFNEVHQLENDWQCMNCQKTFTMAYLAETKWFHRC